MEVETCYSSLRRELEQLIGDEDGLYSTPAHREHTWRRHGIKLTAAEFDRIKESQGGTCACCDETKSLCADHDHATGQVRGALCHRCNRVLGQVKDDPEHLRRLADYLDG